MSERTRWRLSLEPVGDAMAWSLFRSQAQEPVELVGAGVLRGLADVKRLAAGALPAGSGRGPTSLWSGPLVDHAAERELAGLLGPTLLPSALTTALLAADHDEVKHSITLAPRGWLAAIPWDAVGLTRSADVRLLERARVLGGLPPGLRRGDDPRAPGGLPGGQRGLAVIDPGPATSLPRPIYPGQLPEPLMTGLEGYVEGNDGPCSAKELATLLASERWARLCYLGHIRTGTEERPASAALVLADGLEVDHLSARQWLASPTVWPCPPRVALIGCGSDDSGPAEHAGLATAAASSGAELIITTRWTLPTDWIERGELGTSRLAAAVAGALEADDPVDAVLRWQRNELGRWRSTGRTEHSPLLWSSLVAYKLVEEKA